MYKMAASISLAVVFLIGASYSIAHSQLDDSVSSERAVFKAVSALPANLEASEFNYDYAVC